MAENKIILIPAYEPDEKIITLLNEFRDNTDFKIIVVNDGSSNDKNKLFNDIKQYAIVLDHKINKGKGQALKTGINYIKENFPGNTIIATVDADGQHTVSDSIKVINQAEIHRDALVIGSRIFKKDTPIRSIMGNYITRFIYMLISGVKINDTQTGLRAFSSDIIPFLQDIKGNRYEYEMNVLIECAREDIPIIEVPIEAVYLNNNESSHFNSIKDSLRIYKHIIKYGATNILCPIINIIIYCLSLYYTKTLISIISIIISNGIAGITSFSMDYVLNKRRYVNKKQNKFKNNLSYFIDYIFSIIITTSLITFINIIIKNKIIDKIIVEILFFAINFITHNIKLVSYNKNIK